MTCLIYRVQDSQEDVGIAVVQLWLKTLKWCYIVILTVKWFTFHFIEHDDG